ncbi:hypothetical protein BGZ80_007953 [Entomortierella chlamydospora]|uniref:Ubiquitin-like protein ATG12 n=1 Tax=Entomortierella chlamydospora TaxID=101097 RepID=A0A9P6MYC6_9FUNG|nr:hypothetical protein BGZ79_005332 [Entomortierella chlamydospora]KAG0017757.1 hypothetical protein BGZ80_007953 [Entomortierella chlamydospora]
MSNSGTPSSETPPATDSAQEAFGSTSTTPAPAPAEPSGPPASPTTVIANHKKKDTSKVRFQAIGNAPILKQKVYTITASNKFLAVIQFLRKQLDYKHSDPLFLYVNSAFSPAPDEIVHNLFKCFNTDGKLIVNYCTSPAWG